MDFSKLFPKQSDALSDEDQIVADAQSAPVRPEYLKLLEMEKAKTTNPGMAFMGTPSPESRAISQMNELDNAKANPNSFSSMGLNALKQLAAKVNPVPSAQAAMIPPSEATTEQSAAPMRLPSGGRSMSTSSSVTTKGPVQRPLGPQLDLSSGGTGVPFKLPNVQDMYGKDLNDDALKGAQDEQGRIQMIANLAKSANLLTAGLSGAKNINNGAIDDVSKNSGQGVQNILARRDAKDKEVVRQKNLFDLATEEEKTNPNSDVSKMARNLLEVSAQKAGLNLKLPQGASLSSLEKIYPNINTLFARLDATEARKESATQRAHEKSMAADAKEDMFYDSEGRKLMTGMRTDPAVTKAQVPHMRLEKAKNMLDGNVPLDSQTLSDIEQDILAATSGGTGGGLGKLQRTERQTTLRHIAELRQKITSGTQDLRQVDPKTVAQVKKVVDSLYENYDHDIKEAQKKYADNTLKIYGDHKKIRSVFEPYTTYERKQAQQAGQAVMSDEDKQAIEWANKNKSNPANKDKALEILKIHGLK